MLALAGKVSSDLIEISLQRPRATAALLWRLLRRGRKYRMKVFAVAQEFEVKAWKIAGEGGLRRAFTVLYLGAAAYRRSPASRTRRSVNSAGDTLIASPTRDWST
jgi:hypothetical protein